HGDVDTERLPQFRTQPKGGRVRIDRQRRDLVGGHVGCVDTGSRLDDTEPVLRDLGAVDPREHSGRLVPYQLAPCRVTSLRVPGDRDESSFYFGDDFARDDHDVTGTKPR